MKQAVIVDCVRTPIGRAHNKLGAYRMVRSDDLATVVVRALLDRTGLDPTLVEDVIFGASGQRGPQGFCVGRMIGILCGLPFDVPGQSPNRLCGSSQQALHQAAHAIVAGAEDVQLVGGLEHMLNVPMETTDEVNPRLFERVAKEMFLIGNTAENMAKRYGVSREAQDRYALESHRKAARAIEQGEFAREIVPAPGHDRQGRPIEVTVDQCVRPDTSLEQLALLQPSFDPLGTVTAGNSSPLNDGACAMLVMSDVRARELGLKPLARIRTTAVAGVDPAVMGMGPIAATRKALARAGMTMRDIDLVEMNESFAVQAIVCQQQLDIPDEKLNVRGGALALGHPLGASGARLVTTLVHALVDRGLATGVATMCVGMGQGVTTIVERC